MKTPATSWWLGVALSVAWLALPLILVSVAPSTDLAQQVAQVRLLGDALGDGASTYAIQWWHPNKLGYLPLIVTGSILDPLAAGRWALIAIAAAWALAIHGLARARGRSLAAAMLASVFFFNHITYWGFVSFLCGVPAFLLFLHVSRPDAGRRGTWTLLGASLLLYATHVLWLAVGLLWLVLDGVHQRRWRATLVRLLWTSPALILTALWYRRFATTGFDSETHWGQSLWTRLHPDWLVPSALGGLRGSVPAVIAAACLVWVLLGVWQHRRTWRRDADPRLLLAGGLLALLAFTLPGVHQHTIFFASRWLPAACILLVLGTPPPAVRPLLRRGLAVLLVASLALATTNTWLAFERHELDGFVPALAAVPSGTRLLGLDFVRQSPRLRDYPFYHLYAYAQARGGGTLNRSFADQASSLVVFRDLPKDYPWTRDLDWRAHTVREDDLKHFDHVLVYAPPEIHAQLGNLEPITPPRPWRLYRVP